MAFAAVFLAGAIVGTTCTGLFIKHHFTPPKDKNAFRERMTQQLTDGIQHGLDLSDQEMEPIRTEVAAALKLLQDMHAEIRPKAEAIIAEGIRRVKIHLSPEQQVAFDHMIEKTRKREFNIFRLPPPPPPFP
ncbi:MULTISPECIES: hypothetical protein [unclassified Pseudodesulfovibrio]|uniref:hypothetical protein n=1 Tax=unclassified Pseudodesulfovibrio TaxID=2661612 RepID=UPI000FEBE5A2|nr:MULTISPECIES: hypothetical protein [unclassified Pseudodesulfovibrio]MCJ2163628.1 hypothetical protein [Pseudodesulfovibrio sp. S3-i]